MINGMDATAVEMMSNTATGSAAISKSKRRRDRRRQKQQQQKQQDELGYQSPDQDQHNYQKQTFPNAQQQQQQEHQKQNLSKQHQQKQASPNQNHQEKQHPPAQQYQKEQPPVQQNHQKQQSPNEQQQEHHQKQQAPVQQEHQKEKSPRQPQEKHQEKHQSPGQSQPHQDDHPLPQKQPRKHKDSARSGALSDGVGAPQPESSRSEKPVLMPAAIPTKTDTAPESQQAAAVAGDGATKSKAQLRAERRAKQEAQRAAKADKLAAAGKAPPAAKDGEGATVKAARMAPSEAAPKPAKKVAKAAEAGPKESDQKKENLAVRVMDEVRQDDPQIVKRRHKKMEKQMICPRVDIRKKVDLFSHLPQHQIGGGLLSSDWKGGLSLLHSAVYRYGMSMAYGELKGAHSRCCALIDSVLRIIKAHEFSKDKEFTKDFESVLSPNITFLSQCRPMTAGMRGFIKYLKANVVSIGRDDKLEDKEKKKELKAVCISFYKERLLLARETICERAATKIHNGDCLLVYAYSSIVRLVLDYAWKKELKFRVIVADSDPLWEGREMLRQLESAGIPCEYVSLSGVPSIMPRVDRVLLGAQALLNNGSVLSRAGTGLVAAMAHEFRSSVIVLCESYKFWERVQIDSFVYNELGDPNALVDCESMRQLWDDPKSGLHYLNPIYDITPSDLVDMVITEKSIMPATSVPVVLRSKNPTGI